MNCPHCNNPIDEHEATRCLDTWVADVVMGYTTSPGLLWTSRKSDHRVPKYSTEIEEAWEVANALVGMNWKVFIGIDMKDGNYCRLEWHDPFDPKWNQFMARGTNAPLAICRAALKAKSK